MNATQHHTPATQFESWGSLAQRLDALVCGDEKLQLADADGFDETMPAVCWAVPGAYAVAVES